MNKQKLSRNTIEGSIAENMSMTFMQGRATYSMSKARMRKLENSSKILQEKLLSKRQNFRSKLQGQNSMSSQLIFIIWPPQGQFQVYTILHTHSSNHKHSMSTSRLILRAPSKQTIIGNLRAKKKQNFSEHLLRSNRVKRTK